MEKSRYILLKKGYVMEFQDVESTVWVMEARPWSFENKPLVIKPWSPKTNLEREDLAIVPIWIHFPH